MSEEQSFNIAVVDDSARDAESLCLLIQNFGTARGLDFRVRHFESGEKFLSGMKKPDVIFLDIDMPGMNGLELAKKIRKMSSQVILIFCTNLEQFAINGYEVNAIGYLLKPIDPYWFEFVMNKACNLLHVGKRSIIVVRTSTEQVVINVSDILYVEVQAHNIIYYVMQGGKLTTVKSRGSMREVCGKLERYQFARCSVCYLVNLRKIISLKRNEVNLPDVNLPITRTFKQEFNDRFMQYLARYEM